MTSEGDDHFAWYQPSQVVSVDPDLSDQSDYGSMMDSVSYRSGVADYVYENGRRYHRYSEGKYLMPNDETEQDRLDARHHTLLVLLRGQLFCAPIEDPKHILDVGTGTGIWALDAAEIYPDAQVIGVDLSPIQHQWAWPNCKFDVDDVEKPWMYPPAHFDFIHVRELTSAIREWDYLTQQMFAHTKPGGYVEISDLDIQMYSDDNSVPPNSALRRGFTLMRAGLMKAGVRLLVGQDMKVLLEKTGFVDVQVRIFKMPFSPWARDRTLKEVGRCMLQATEADYEAYWMAILTRVHGWSPEEARKLCEAALDDMRNHRIHAYGKVWHVYGRRPEEEGGKAERAVGKELD